MYLYILYNTLNLTDFFDFLSQPDVKDHVINLQFSWKGLIKPIGSSFIGVSPEFEMALFTIIFVTNNNHISNTVVNLQKYLLEIVVYRFEQAIGTSYPKLLSSNNRDA